MKNNTQNPPAVQRIQLKAFTEDDFMGFSGAEDARNMGMPALLGEGSNGLVIVDTNGINVIIGKDSVMPGDGESEWSLHTSYAKAVHIATRLLPFDFTEEDLEILDFEQIL